MTGLVLAGLLESGAVDDEPNRTKLAVKLLVAVVVVALVESNHKKDPVPAGVFHAVGALALLNVLVAILW